MRTLLRSTAQALAIAVIVVLSAPWLLVAVMAAHALVLVTACVIVAYALADAAEACLDESREGSR